MASFVPQGMVACKLTATFFAQIILRPVRFLSIPFYIYTLAIGAMEGDCYLHLQKYQFIPDCQIFTVAYCKHTVKYVFGYL
jgi:hypothetical protein